MPFVDGQYERTQGWVVASASAWPSSKGVPRASTQPFHELLLWYSAAGLDTVMGTLDTARVAGVVGIVSSGLRSYQFVVGEIMYQNRVAAFADVISHPGEAMSPPAGFVAPVPNRIMWRPLYLALEAPAMSTMYPLRSWPVNGV